MNKEINDNLDNKSNLINSDLLFELDKDKASNLNLNNILNLNTKLIGTNIVHYKEIDSTQKEIWRRVENKQIQNGTLILADIQTDAIGTHGRTWYTTKTNNIAFSFLLYPNIPVRKLEKLTIQIAKIIVEVFEELYKINLEIKLPNDIIIQTNEGIKKIGGILTQTKLKGEIVKCLVIGIGINTNQQQFKKEIKNIATSIKNEFGINVNNNNIITEFCNKFEEIYIRILEK